MMVDITPEELEVLAHKLRSDASEKERAAWLMHGPPELEEACSRAIIGAQLLRARAEELAALRETAGV